MANRTPIIALGVAVIAAGIWGGKKYLYSRDHVDDRQRAGRRHG